MITIKSLLNLLNLKASPESDMNLYKNLEGSPI